VGSSRAARLYDSRIRSVNVATGLSSSPPESDCALRCSSAASFGCRGSSCSRGRL